LTTKGALINGKQGGCQNLPKTQKRGHKFIKKCKIDQKLTSKSDQKTVKKTRFLMANRKKSLKLSKNSQK